MNKINKERNSYFYRCTVRSVVYLITHTNKSTYTYYLRSLKFTFKHLKRSYMFRSHIILREHILFLAKVII